LKDDSETKRSRPKALRARSEGGSDMKSIEIHNQRIREDFARKEQVRLKKIGELEKKIQVLQDEVDHLKKKSSEGPSVVQKVNKKEQ